MPKRYTREEKEMFKEFASKVKSRQQLETEVAPYLATKLNRSQVAIIRQVEIILGWHYRDNF